MLVEEDAEHRTGLMRLDRDAGFLGLLEPAEQELLRLERQHAAVVRLARLRLCRDDLERLDAGRHRERIARERARLVDGARRRDLHHDVASSAVGRDRQAAADDLAEACEVRRDAIGRLCAAERCAEAAHNFIEDQDRAVCLRELADLAQVALLRRHAAHIARDRLDDDRCDLVAHLIHDLRDGLDIIVGYRDRVRRRALRDAGRTRHAERRHARTGVDEQAVAVAVVAADELDDLLAPRVAARQAQRAHRRLRARVDHADDLNGRVDLHDELRELRL